jgi:acetate---CoA ligase (ADP-forming)
MQLDRLLKPKSIAIYGASDRPSIGRSLVDGLDRLGFEGRVCLVNPRYQELLGRQCYPTIAALPEPVDVTAFCVGPERVLDGITDCAKRGVGAAVIYAGGFGEQAGKGEVLQNRIVQICQDAGIALCGPNCMGVVNPVHRSSTYMQEVRDSSRLAGNIGLISQSGSICIAMLSDVRRFGYSLVVSSGNEAVVSAVDYMDFLIDDENTTAIALFLESVRAPDRFIAALDRASDRGKPVVVLKVGQTERAKRAISSHTGGLAGEARVFSEVLRAHRAIEVHDVDELTEVLVVAGADQRPKGTRLGVVTSSGGKAELMLDLAARHGLDLPPLPPDVAADVERVIGPLTGDGNPLDAWGNGNFNVNFPHALRALDANPLCDAVVLSTDVADNDPMGHPERGLRYARILAEAAAQATKPHYMLGLRSGVMEQAQIDFLRQHNIPTIGGIRQGLGALAKLGARSTTPGAYLPDHRLRGGGIAALTADRAQRHSINEFDAKRLLSANDLPVTREILAKTWREARSAAVEIGFPVVLKVASDHIPHKSDLGLVAVGLDSVETLEKQWVRMEAIMDALPTKTGSAGFLIQEMVTGGLEVMAGVSRDPEFGLVLAFGMGGVAVEMLKDVALRILPLRVGDAEAMINQTKTAQLLHGARTSTPYDVRSLVRCLETFATYVWADRDNINEIDLNPILILPEGRGCRIVDALIIPRYQESFS